MKDYLTEAIILGRLDKNEHDQLIDLFTKDLGRVRAKASGTKKILSKFSPHLDVLNLVIIRLVKKNFFTIADVLTKDRFYKLRKSGKEMKLALAQIKLLRETLPELDVDSKLWHECISGYKKKSINIEKVLKIMGYDSKFAECALCKNRKPFYFLPKKQEFSCSRCCPNKEKNFCIYLNNHGQKDEEIKNKK